MELKWTKTALQSIDNIADYISKDNPQMATEFVVHIQDILSTLLHFPWIGKTGRVLGTRELVLHENYLAVYRVKQDEIQILRIHHTRKKR